MKTGLSFWWKGPMSVTEHSSGLEADELIPPVAQY